MDIKLRARLSAYSKVNSLNNGGGDCPCDGDPITNEQIDELFKDTDQPRSVTKSEIDALFTKTEEPKSVSKSEIDNLFVDGDDVVTSVSFKEIDSLFSKK